MLPAVFHPEGHSNLSCGMPPGVWASATHRVLFLIVCNEPLKSHSVRLVGMRTSY